MGEQLNITPPPYFVPPGYVLCKSCNKAVVRANFDYSTGKCLGCRARTEDHQVEQLPDVIKRLTENLKHCSRCGKDKHPLDFAQNRSAKDGLQHWCRACHNSLKKLRVPTKPVSTTVAQPSSATQRCARCGETKPVGAFWKDASRLSGRCPTCTKCNTTRRHRKLAAKRAHAARRMADPASKPTLWARLKSFVGILP